MKPKSSPERELKLLVEDYGTRTGQWLEETVSRAHPEDGAPTANGAAPPQSSLPRSALPHSTSPPSTTPRSKPAQAKPSSQDVHLLLDDYSVRSARWWQGFDKAAARRAAEAARRSPLPGPKILLEDYHAFPVPKLSTSKTPGGTVAGPPARVLPPVAIADQQPLDFEVAWDAHLTHPRARTAAVVSLITHTVLLIVLLMQRSFIVTQPRDLREGASYPEITLLAPPDSVIRELTQPSPNEGPATVEFKGAKEAPAPALVLPEELAPPSPAPEAPPEAAPPKIEVEPEAPKAPEPPKPEAQPKPPAPKAAQSPNPDDFRPNARLSRQRGPGELPLPRRPANSNRPPKLVLENPKSGLPGREGPLELGSLGLNARPGQMIQGAINTLSSGGGPPSRQAVGDTFGTGGLSGYMPPSSGTTGSNLELLSDPKGVDFRPYLIRILATVRRNWFAVVPESARLGMSKGRVSIQLAIVRNGTVSKLVIAKSSGSSPLDRAAVAGISASNPFPPLPPDYAGTDVRLQFAFLYNIKK